MNDSSGKNQLLGSLEKNNLFLSLRISASSGGFRRTLQGKGERAVRRKEEQERKGDKYETDFTSGLPTVQKGNRDYLPIHK